MEAIDINDSFLSRNLGQLLLLLYDCHVGAPPSGTNMASRYKTLNWAETLLRITGLNLGEVNYHILNSFSCALTVLINPFSLIPNSAI